PVRSPLLRESRLISLPPGTEMFQFPGSARGFRVRRSLGSSPGLFAAFHARILMTPRHPPRALRSLTTPIRPPPGGGGLRMRRGGVWSAPPRTQRGSSPDRTHLSLLSSPTAGRRWGPAPGGAGVPPAAGRVVRGDRSCRRDGGGG